ncbi:hypothetical protein C8N24_6104 [Solirubrobacter pauli]|uniref:Uncharacterized protein n=1 Tax=Solirubrobacter pauli TaxID=166793 RepID=A0A660L416_9ACTN|nr:hypothetical protein [Solirubrobacter pauli]RKQ88065.1 hypothetical protein C8N24_6104 [Solirubrobacter pauli]
MSVRSTCLLGALALAIASCGSSSTPVAASCKVDRGELPAWATTGFSDPHPKMPHVVGAAGRIAAILFADPLRATDGRDGPQNKILWVARDPQQAMSDLTIRAVHGDDTLERTVPGGPGPSVVDLPKGCWTLELSWSGRTDRLNLQYD